MTSKSDNQAKAPIAAAVVAQFRAVFGDDCKALYVKEGEFEIGTPSRKDYFPAVSR